MLPVIVVLDRATHVSPGQLVVQRRRHGCEVRVQDHLADLQAST